MSGKQEFDADMVKVVRCGKCGARQKDEFGNPHCALNIIPQPRPFDYCSRATVAKKGVDATFDNFVQLMKELHNG